MTPDAHLDREFAFSIQPCADGSCGDLHPGMLECRRLAGHGGEHAAGFGSGRVRWDGEVAA